MAFEHDTDSMHNERDMVRALVAGKHYRPGLTFDDAELAAIQQPVLMVYGTADPVGTLDIWKRTTSQLPSAELHLVAGGGHMPWFDDPSQIADRIRRFLAD